MFNEVSLMIAVAGTVLSAFVYLTNPARDNDTAIQLLKAQVVTQEATISTITKTQQNDTQEVKLELGGLRQEIQSLSEQTVKLQTIIEERIPKQR